MCANYDEVMTNVEGKDGACAAAIHVTIAKPMTSWG